MKKDQWPEIVKFNGGGKSSMPRRAYFIASVVLIVAVLLVGIMVTYSNIKFAQEGTVQVVTKWGAIERIYTPSDGWFTTIAPGRKSYEVNIKSFTESAPVRVTSKDNAALQVDISLTAYSDPTKIAEYVRKYGFSEEERHRRRNEILKGIVQTEARDRKSTRLNSSHLVISYAVFCLKKKKNQ